MNDAFELARDYLRINYKLVTVYVHVSDEILSL